jgi:hypothetical protein
MLTPTLFIIATVAVLVYAYFVLMKSLKNQKLYDNHIIECKHWAKILYFGGQINSGTSYLKLSDGRKFSIWKPAFSSAYKFKQFGTEAFTGSYLQISNINSEIIYELNVNEQKHQIKLDINRKAFNIKDSSFTIPVEDLYLSNQIRKNNESFASVDKSNFEYVEITFKKQEVSPDELFIVSFVVMSEKLI